MSWGKLIRWTLVFVGTLVVALAVGAYLYLRPPTNPARGTTAAGEGAGDVVTAGAHDWPQFRGPKRDGTSPEMGWSARWSAPPRVLWERDVGTGAAGVSVSAGRLYTVGSLESSDVVYCLVAETGREIWRFTYTCALSKRQFEGGPAGTPTVDGERVYTLSHEGQLFCLDALRGNSLWSCHVIHDLGGSRPFWGYAGSPLLAGNLLVVPIGGSGTATVALDKTTGKVVWKAGDDKAGYSSPVRMDVAGKPGVVVFQGVAVVGHDIEKGTVAWRYPWETSYDVNAATPVVSGSRIFISSGYDRGGALLDVSAGEPRPVWENTEMRNHMSSCLLHEGHIFGVDDGGDLKCMELATGSVRWKKGGFGKGTVILVGATLIVLSERGDLVTAAAGTDAYEEIARARVLQGRCWVSPSFANGLLYVRNNQGKVACLDLRT